MRFLFSYFYTRIVTYSITLRLIIRRLEWRNRIIRVNFSDFRQISFHPIKVITVNGENIARVQDVTLCIID